MFSKKIEKPKTYFVEYEEQSAELKTYQIIFHFDGKEIKGTVKDEIVSYQHLFRETKQSFESFYIKFANGQTTYHQFGDWSIPLVYYQEFTTESGEKSRINVTPNMTIQLIEKESQTVTYKVPILKEVQ